MPDVQQAYFRRVPNHQVLWLATLCGMLLLVGCWAGVLLLRPTPLIRKTTNPINFTFAHKEPIMLLALATVQEFFICLGLGTAIVLFFAVGAARAYQERHQ